jgi:hypothetical protein
MLCYLKNKIIKIRHHNIVLLTDLYCFDTRANKFSLEAHRSVILLLL